MLKLEHLSKLRVCSSQLNVKLGLSFIKCSKMKERFLYFPFNFLSTLSSAPPPTPILILISLLWVPTNPGSIASAVTHLFIPWKKQSAFFTVSSDF